MLRSPQPVARLAIAVATAVACTSTAGDLVQHGQDDACANTASQPIVHGASHESFLGIAQDQIQAVVQVIDGSDVPGAGGPLCSGTFVAPRWVLTARHCLQIKSPNVVVAAEGPSAAYALPVVTSVAHASLDLLLLEIGDPDGGDASGLGDARPSVPGFPRPIPVARTTVARLRVGDAVEVAGFGLTETRSFGALRFLVEPVIAVGASSISVSGSGRSGACEGDSGGPLLVRGDDGGVHVAAVLSTGSADCLGEDTYARVDVALDWIQTVTGATNPTDADCEALIPTGRCLYGAAVWCSAGRIAAAACTGTSRCGWDIGQSGYRCLSAGSDPCGGVDSVGVCHEGAALRCDNGTLRRTPCGCRSCRIDPTSGVPGCGG